MDYLQSDFITSLKKKLVRVMEDYLQHVRRHGPLVDSYILLSGQLTLEVDDNRSTTYNIEEKVCRTDQDAFIFLSSSAVCHKSEFVDDFSNSNNFNVIISTAENVPNYDLHAPKDIHPQPDFLLSPYNQHQEDEVYNPMEQQEVDVSAYTQHHQINVSQYNHNKHDEVSSYNHNGRQDIEVSPYKLSGHHEVSLYNQHGHQGVEVEAVTLPAHSHTEISSSGKHELLCHTESMAPSQEFSPHEDLSLGQNIQVPSSSESDHVSKEHSKISLPNLQKTPVPEAKDESVSETKDEFVKQVSGEVSFPQTSDSSLPLDPPPDGLASTRKSGRKTKLPSALADDSMIVTTPQSRRNKQQVISSTVEQRAGGEEPSVNIDEETYLSVMSGKLEESPEDSDPDVSDKSSEETNIIVRLGKRLGEEAVAEKMVKSEQLNCPYCMKQFTDKKQLQIHTNTHTGDKPYMCHDCGKAFADPGYLVKHRRIHTGEKPYVCDICSKAFRVSSSLKMHRRIHTGERPFKCDLCDRGFKQRSQLIYHYRVHTGEKAYKCEECGVMFSRVGNLERHKLDKHSDKKEFTCNVCGLSFKRKAHLGNHMRIHTGDRPFSCRHCEKSFTHEATRWVHELSHSARKPYVCETCGKNFSARGVLNRHQKKHTPDEVFVVPEVAKSRGVKRCMELDSVKSGTGDRMEGAGWLASEYYSKTDKKITEVYYPTECEKLSKDVCKVAVDIPKEEKLETDIVNEITEILLKNNGDTRDDKVTKIYINNEEEVAASENVETYIIYV